MPSRQLQLQWSEGQRHLRLQRHLSPRHRRPKLPDESYVISSPLRSLWSFHSLKLTDIFQEENRLRAKAIRDQREAEQRAAGKTSNTPKSAAGFVPTEHVHVSKPVNGKRLYSEISTQASSGMASGTNRDGRNKGDEEALRPARKFTKFVDYNMSSMTDTKGGFLTTEDDPHNYALGAKKPGQEDEQRPKDMTVQEWERMQLIRKLQRQKAGPFEPGISVLDDEEKRKKCRECKSLEIDFVWEEVFHICVCNKCKEKYPEKYSLLTKTECKEDYLLTDREFYFSSLSFFFFARILFLTNT